MYHDDVEYAGHAPTENMTVYKVFPPITYWKSEFITDQEPLLEVLCD